MNPLDILMIVILSYCLIAGLLRGIIREIASIVGVFAGFFLAYTYYIKVGKYLSKWISDPSYLPILSFLAIFCTVLIFINLLGLIIKYLLKKASLTWLDRAGGGGIGIIKGILITSVLLMIFTTFLKEDAPVIKNSVLAPHIQVLSEQMANLASKEMKQKYKEKLESLKKAWQTQTQQNVDNSKKKQ